MVKRVLEIVAVFLLMCPLGVALAAGDPQDKKGGKDPALFSRMPGFHIYNYEELDFDRYEFPVGPDKNEPVEGRHYYVDYYANDGIKLPSALQISRNYINAAKAIGGQTVYEFEDGGTQYVTLKVVKDNAEAWAALSAGGNGMYKIHVIEKQLMKQDVVANADSLAGSIRETGKVVVYGIYFDTDKDRIKPESEPALNEIAKMLKAQPQLKVYVVGHTDNVGGFDHNLKLSSDRAGAVTNALVQKHGISATRLKPFGVGPTSPAASNQTEQGRAKNRRVELVAQ